MTDSAAGKSMVMGTAVDRVEHSRCDELAIRDGEVTVVAKGGGMHCLDAL